MAEKSLFEQFAVGAMLPQVPLTDESVLVKGDKNVFTSGDFDKYIKTSIDDEELEEDNSMDNINSTQLKDFFFKENNPDIPDLIEPMVNSLEAKGYKVKYSSPGHMNTNFKSDRNDDHVVNGKFASTARIIFDDKYQFEELPQGWEFKTMNDANSALYVKPYSYNEDQGSTNEAFIKWQTSYLDNLKTWIKGLKNIK